MKTSEKFELQIKRIHDLIEQPSSKVTWNDHFPDPDNPTQPRQIDITIRYDNTLTLIECRIHTKKQNVNWIEELMGRRMSLKADAVIAVSASGFTEGAITKAKVYGIILRDILTLTEEEIRKWGHKTKVRLTFYNYKNIRLTFFFDKVYKNQISIDKVFSDLQKHYSAYGIFETAAQALTERNPKGRPCQFKAMIHNDKMLITGQKVLGIQFEASFKTIKKTLKIPSVVVYDTPEIVASRRKISIEKVDFGDFEITQSSNKVSAAIDLSPVKVPANSQFRFVTFDFKRTVFMKSFEIIGLPKMEIPINDIEIGVAFS